MELIQENVIVTGHWNIPLLSQIWLVDQGIVSREEFATAASAVFTPAMMQVAAAEFGLFAIEDRIQFTPTCEDARKGALIVDRVGRLVELLPQTPYTGVGLNFIWHYQPSGTMTVSTIGRRLFFKEDSSLAKEFNTEDAKFGGYYSKNVLGFRLKLSTAPVDIQMPEQPTQEIIQFAFNYHLGSKSPTEIRRALNNWDKAKAHSAELTHSIEQSI